MTSRSAVIAHSFFPLRLSLRLIVSVKNAWWHLEPSVVIFDFVNTVYSLLCLLVLRTAPKLMKSGRVGLR